MRLLFIYIFHWMELIVNVCCFCCCGYSSLCVCTMSICGVNLELASLLLQLYYRELVSPKSKLFSYGSLHFFISISTILFETMHMLLHSVYSMSVFNNVNASIVDCKWRQWHSNSAQHQHRVSQAETDTNLFFMSLRLWCCMLCVCIVYLSQHSQNDFSNDFMPLALLNL